MFLIDSAWAQSSGGGDPLGLFMPLILIFVVFYFLLIRPQQKRAKAHQAKVAAISKGDEVLTNGGIYGKVVNAKDELTVMVEIAKGVEVKVTRHMVADVLNPKNAPEAPKSLFGSLFGSAKPAAANDDSKDSKAGSKSKAKPKSSR